MLPLHLSFILPTAREGFQERPFLLRAVYNSVPSALQKQYDLLYKQSVQNSLKDTGGVNREEMVNMGIMLMEEALGLPVSVTNIHCNVIYIFLIRIF